MPFGTRHQMVNLQRTHQPRMTLHQIRNANQTHGGLELVTHDIDEVLDALLAVVQRVQEGAADANGRGTQTQGLQHVGAAPDAAVQEDLERVEDVRAQAVQFEEREERGWGAGGLLVGVSAGLCFPLLSCSPPFSFPASKRSAGRGAAQRARETRRETKTDENSRIQIPPPVITNHDRLHSILNRQPRVRRTHNPLQHNRQLRQAPQPPQIRPAQRRIDISGHNPAQTAALGVVLGAHPIHGREQRLVGALALVGFALAGDGPVDGDEDGADAEGGGGAEEGGRGGAVFADVELEEEGVRRGCGGGD